ncbi:methyltransferase domain-containing protein [Xanthomonas arboricola]|uniref:methyltransferase domain-containing protein n=1 Tax=Xanthomonas arboricola TaxID=56448 RepID=UPI000CBFC30D|nr:methyltransferase domain-containing protein [Xanthomonas arboricola]SOU07150.1 hypothetical protein LMG19144_02202 [Xanthomonas arboricola pv. fragariae]
MDLRPRIDDSHLYGPALDAGLDGIRMLVDHTARGMFAAALVGTDDVHAETFLGPSVADDAAAQPAAVAGHGVRKALLDYLLDEGRLTLDEQGRVRASSTLTVAAAERQSADALVSTRPELADARELLGVFERRAADLLAGADGITILRDTLGFQRMQALWERLTLHLPQRRVERQLGAELLIERMRRQRSGITVLECGAGVGSVLRTALELPGFIAAVDALERYVYTDINPFLIEWSKDWFRRNAPPALFARMEFQVLDLDAGSCTQSPAAGSVDLVILDDVAHDVVDVVATLQWLGTLLSADGWLAMIENFRQPARDFLFIEIFPITFHSYNKARLGRGSRINRGFMSLPEWRSALDQAGLQALQVVPDPHHHHRWPMGGIVAACRA